jgi:hypothetical protein
MSEKGKQWNDLSEEEKQQVGQQFTRMLIEINILHDLIQYVKDRGGDVLLILQRKGELIEEYGEKMKLYRDIALEDMLEENK